MDNARRFFNVRDNHLALQHPRSYQPPTLCDREELAKLLVQASGPAVVIQ